MMLQVRRQRSCYASQDKDVSARYPGACDAARKQPGCVLFLRRRIPLLSGSPSRRPKSIRRGVARLRADDQSRASVDDAASHRRYFTAHAAPRTALCSVHQTPVPMHRYAVGRAPQGEPSASGQISPHLYAVHRIEPSCGGHGAVS